MTLPIKDLLGDKKFIFLKDILKKILGVPLTLLAFLFIFKIIYSSKNQILPHILHINFPVAFLGIFFLFGYFLLRGFLWKKVLFLLGEKTSFKSTLYFFSLSEIKRYIPGSIFSFASRADNFSKLKVPGSITLKGLFIESVFLISSSLFIGLKGLEIIPKFNLQNPVIFLVLLLIAIYLFTRNKIKSSFLELVDLFLLFSLAWLIFGIGNYFIASSFVYLDPKNFFVFSSFFVLSWLVGYLSIVTPMGLGVREGVLIAGLSGTLGLPLATTIALILRLFLIISEILFLGVSYAIFKVKTNFEKYWSQIILGLSSASYIIYFSYISIEKHLNFFTGRFDLGNMDQTVWNTIHGRIFMLTNPDSTNTISRLSIHADFILILLSPFYYIYKDPVTLLVIQSTVLGLGAIFVYLTSQKVLGDKALSLVFAISFLLNPFVQKQNLYDFHPVTLATTFLLAAFYFMINKRYVFFLLFLSLAVLTKENIYLIASFMGGYIFIKDKKKLGIFISLFSVVMFYLLITKFIPEARGGNHFALEYFQEFGDSPVTIVKNIITHPEITFPTIFSQANFDYVRKLFLSTGFLSLLSPFYLLFSGTDLFINLLSLNQNFKSINYHYAAAIIPFIYISSIYAVKTLLEMLKIKQDKDKKRFLKFVVYYVIFFSVYSSYQYGVLPGDKYPSLEVFRERVLERDAISTYISKIPRRLSVAATNNLGAHLSHREKIYTIPIGMEQADIVMFLLNDVFAQPSLQQQKQMVADLRENPNYRQIYENGPFIVFERK